jgi:hypothetical protein
MFQSALFICQTLTQRSLMCLDQIYPMPFRRIRAFLKFQQRVLCIGAVLLAVLLSTGCTQPISFLSSASESVAPQLEIERVDPFGQPGGYRVTGRTNLPNQTQITVSAIRYLQPAEPSISFSGDSSYSVLARQFAPVEQGTWEANLTLWQVAPDGKFQEAWQSDQGNLGIQVQPDPNVTFLVTLDPANQPATLQDQLDQGEAFTGSLVQFNADGELYLQASKTMVIALPTGGTAPPTDQSESARSTSSSTSNLEAASVSPPTLSPTQTDSPIPSRAFLR